MAYTLNGSAQYFSGAGVVTAYPFTFSAWAYTGATDVGCLLWNGWAASSVNERYTLDVSPAVKARVVARGGSGTTTVATSAGTVTTNAWNHFCGVFLSASSRTIWLNGANSATNTTTTDPMNASNITVTRVGSFDFAGEDWDNALCMASIWSTDLSESEIVSLAKGFDARRIRPQSLRFSAPLVRNVQDISRALALTTNGSPTVSAHPRVY